MNTFAVTEAGAEPTTITVDTPEPSAGQVRVRVTASSVNTTDIGTAVGMTVQWGMPHIYPVTLGRDFAGTVTAVGDGVDTVAVGCEVFGEIPFVPPLHAGAWADEILTAEETVVRRPADVDVVSAGAAPLAAITALAVIDALKLKANETVLIVGATGGVGSIVAQLARATGATVIAPARTDDEAFLSGVGVHRTVPRDGDVVAAVRELYPDGVDAVVDLVTFGRTGVYDAALNQDGRVASATNAAGDGDRRFNVNHVPGRDVLTRLADLLSAGTIRIPVYETFSFEQLPDALESFRTHPHHGKIALHHG